MYIPYANTGFADFEFRDLDIKGLTKNRKLSDTKKKIKMKRKLRISNLKAKELGT